MKPPAEEIYDGSSQPITSPTSLNRPAIAFSVGRGDESLSSRSSSDQQLPILEKSILGSLNGSTLTDRSRQRSSSPATPSLKGSAVKEDYIRSTIVRSFAPHVGVYSSLDTEQLVATKGYTGGLTELLKPFAQQIQGKVVVRDSRGVSKAWDDFGVRIYNSNSPKRTSDSLLFSDGDTYTRSNHERTLSSDLDLLLNQGLENERMSRESAVDENSQLLDSPRVFSKYLHLLLSSGSLVPFETFCHPVAAIIAVSSHSESPIETLRQLYALSGPSNSANPEWLGSDYLRYYVLIHDEDNSEIARSTALFDLMKRHFGLHCHLLRLRSSQCVASDDDSVVVRPCEWQSIEEIVSDNKRQDDLEYLEHNDRFVFESDANAINVFLREMVTQSIIPFMENRVMTWNDQVASRKRGIGGRFMSLSKRWAGFGSSKASNGGTTGPGSSNFNVQGQFYPPETPEAILRQLADYAMMLRDWRLAYSTYDLMRSDFSHDKAWTYHAAASEMAALTAILLPQHSNFRPDAVDQLIDAAVYSYLTRCSAPGKAKRCLILATELLYHRHSSLAGHAARWASRTLELAVLSPMEQNLIAERIADYYSSGVCTASKGLPSKARHAATWNVIATSAWITSEHPWEGGKRLQDARLMYSGGQKTANLPFDSMQPLWSILSTSIEPISSHDSLCTGAQGTSVDPNLEREQVDVFIADQVAPSKGDEVGLASPPRPTATALQPIIDHGDQNDGFE